LLPNEDEDEDATDSVTYWFNSSVVDVPDETDEAQRQHAVRRRPFDSVAFYHRNVVRSAQVQLYAASTNSSINPSIL